MVLVNPKGLRWSYLSLDLNFLWGKHTQNQNRPWIWMKNNGLNQTTQVETILHLLWLCQWSQPKKTSSPKKYLGWTHFLFSNLRLRNVSDSRQSQPYPQSSVPNSNQASAHCCLNPPEQVFAGVQQGCLCMGAHQGEQHGSLQDPWDFHLLLERVDAKVGRRQPQAASRSMVSMGGTWWYWVAYGCLNLSRYFCIMPFLQDHHNISWPHMTRKDRHNTS